MKPLASSLALIALAAPVAAQDGSSVLPIARSTGAVLGAATACGIAEDRAAAVGRLILAPAETKLAPAAMRAIRAAQAEAAQAASLRQRKEGQPDCDTAVASFRGFEDAMTDKP